MEKTKRIERIIQSAIQDFNGKWGSHSEMDEGISEYATEIAELDEWVSVDLFLKQRGLNPQEKLDNDTDGYWTLKDLLIDFIDQSKELNKPNK